jgi:CRISPR-associated protein Csh2
VKGDATKKSAKAELKINTLAQRYVIVFGEEVDKKNQINVIKNFFTAIDTITFGGTFAEAGSNFNSTGVVQFNHFINKYDKSNPISMQILSPFPSDTESSASSIGEQIIVDEAHYFGGFSVFPNQTKKFEEIIDDFEGYTEEDYKIFKETSLTCFNNLNTCAKAGCQNEFVMFVELKDESKLAMPDLATFIDFSKEDEVNVIGLTRLSQYLNSKNIEKEIQNIEIYYNSFDSKLEGNINNANIFNILTKEEV